MKRPFAVTGFTMLFAALLLYRLNFKETVAVLCTAAVSFCILMCFKSLRRDKTLLTVILSVAVISASLLFAEYRYNRTAEILKSGETEITATVIREPVNDDYRTAYILKVDSVNGEKRKFKMKYYEKEGRSFERGERVAGITEVTDEIYPDLFYQELADEVYFTAFESERHMLYKTGDASAFHKIIGAVKNYFINTTREYLPGENGKIVNAMVIGERSGVSEKTRDTFNYAGISHLLVVSGLHLTMWSAGIMIITDRSIKRRKIKVALGFLSLLFYAALTGFSVSVLRAGAMISGVLLGKLAGRGSDGLNSVGFALTFILLFNPFASYSAALWLSVMSTTGLLTCSGKLKMYFLYSSPFSRFSHNVIFRKVSEALAVSISVTAFTLPVFVWQFGLLPTASFLANFFAVPAGMLLMVLTVAGMIFDFVGIKFLASGVYFIVGLLARFMRTLAEEIGMAPWSTVPVSGKAFKCFLIAAALIIIAAYVFNRFGKNITRASAVTVSLLFAFTCCYSYSYERNTPSADIISSDGKISVLLNSGGESVLIGSEIKPFLLKEELNKHNAKTLSLLVNTSEAPFSEDKISGRIPTEDTICCGDCKSVTLGGRLKAELSHYESYIVLSCENEKVLIIMSELCENPFENNEEYGIIISRNTIQIEDLVYFGEHCIVPASHDALRGYDIILEKENDFENSSSEVYSLSDGESLDIYWENYDGAYS